MSRTFQDHDLLVWEAYASSGKFGFAAEGVLVFHCLSQPGERARKLSIDGDKADAEQLVERASPDELLDLLERAERLK